MSRWILAAVALVLVGASAPAWSQTPARTIFSFEDPALDRVTSPDLVRFESDAALKAYAARLDRIVQERRSRWIGWQWWSGGTPMHAQYALADPPPCLKPEDCPEAGALQEVVTTATKAAAPSITNNQKAGVDEGDIVKQIGDFLLVLQDGRIFSVDTRDDMRLADRANVYRNPKVDTWYDEMLVQDDRVVVTAYSYEEQASEISVFRLDRTSGRLTREGVFLISSNDYYDWDNYATRIVGDRLVIYTPYDLDEFVKDRKGRPSLRRWLPEAERKRAQVEGRSLFAAQDIYRPVQRVAQPTLHAISICPLGRLRPGVDLGCRTTTLLGPASAEMYVSPEAVFLWTVEGAYSDGGTCAGRAARRDVAPGAVFRIPIAGGEPGVVGVNGQPFDQFSMDSRAGEFRALVDWSSIRCEEKEDRLDVALLRVPEAAFAGRFEPAADRRFHVAPGPGAGGRVRNRFVGDWLAYGGRARWSGYPPDDGDPALSSGQVIVLPVKRPEGAKKLDLPHDVLRLEAVGDDVMADGYRDASGLAVSYVKLGASPHVAATLTLPRRFESEGRSHAFNARVERDGSGLMGLPTVLRPDDAGRWGWWSDASDISFLSFSSSGALAPAGNLLRGEQAKAEGYECEVSCVDWYGNSRPIFIGTRIFGLMETEIAEAREAGGRVVEVRRLDLTASPGTRAKPMAPN